MRSNSSWGRTSNSAGLYGSTRRVVEVETGLTIAASGVDGRTDRFTALIDELVEDLSKRIRADPGKYEDYKLKFVVRRGDSEASITFDEVLLYGRALDALDRGDKRSARETLSRLVAAAPDFATARDLLGQLPPEK